VRFRELRRRGATYSRSENAIRLPLIDQPLSPGEHARTIHVEGRKRAYIVHVPPQSRTLQPARMPGHDDLSSRGLPLVFVFHGGGGTARLAILATGWSQKADEIGFFAVYPEALRPDPQRPPTFLRNPQFWNVGSGLGYAEREGVDDVAFVRALLDELSASLAIDARRVYATGFSNGAALTFRLGMELSDRFAAIGPVAGNLWRQEPKPSRAVSMIYITGTADPMNPLDGSQIGSPWGPVLQPPPIEQTVRTWASWVGCPPEPGMLSDRDGVRHMRYGPGERGAEVDFYIIEGAGHAWPGGLPVLAERLAGKPTDKLNATGVIWEFFERHPRV
jgi:polyhydroxybutyrate depolymerase